MKPKDADFILEWGEYGDEYWLALKDLGSEGIDLSLKSTTDSENYYLEHRVLTREEAQKIVAALQKMLATPDSRAAGD